MKWVAPPNWPATPVGFTPQAGWKPDPSWPDAPEGWQFWQPDESQSWWQRQISLSVDNRHFKLKVGAVAAAVAIVVIIGIVAIANHNNYRNLDAAKLDATISSGIDARLDGSGTTATVDCPSDEPAKPGYKFVCDVTGSDGSKAAVKVTVLNKRGDVQWLLEPGS